MVSELVNDNFKPGSYELNCNFTRLASGVYYYKIETDDFTDVKKMILIK